LNTKDKIIKRIFDIVFSTLGLILFSWLIVLLIILATINTNSFGLFIQKRVGLNASCFKIFKIRTMKVVKNTTTTVTTINDIRLTKLGKFFRKFKLDELPQLMNIFLGDMSFVGPRPDVSGFANELEGEDRIILIVKPGLTGPASLVFRNEEELLAKQENPEDYNRDVIWPEKVAINKEYIEKYTFSKDLQILYNTFFYV
jgi:lipopolysaccharide/colanic/teichoic acid biosynthesis glycosyltransferase